MKLLRFKIIILACSFLGLHKMTAQNKLEVLSSETVFNAKPSTISTATGTFPLQFKCKELTDQDFIPDEASDTIFYRVNFHFFKRKKGVGPYDSVSITDARILTDDFNYRFSHLQAPMLKHPSNPPLIVDSKIRLKLCGYYEHVSDSAFMSGIYNGLDIYNKYNIGGDSIINVFFIQEAVVGNGGHGTYGVPAYVYMNVTNPRYYFWAFLDLFVHEMGHSAGYLFHTDMGGIPDVVVENSNDPSKWGWIPCKKDTVGNNILGYNQCRMYLSPMQIGRWRHQGTFGDRARYTQYCTFDKNKTITVTKNETWSDQRVINGNIIVKKGATLIVRCNLFMANGTKIIVEEGAKMRLQSAIIKSNCTSWQGIEVWGKVKKPKTVHVDSELCDHQGILELTPGAVISNAKVAISVGKRKTNGKFEKGSGGGIVRQVETHLLNNIKDIEYESVEKKK